MDYDNMLPATGLKTLVIAGVAIEFPILGLGLVLAGAALLIGVRFWGRRHPDPAVARR